MEEILTDYDPSTLTLAIENNIYHLLRKAARVSGNICHHTPEISWVMTRDSWPNRIFEARLNSNHPEVQVEQIISYIKCGDAPNLWMVGSSNQPANLGTILSRYGFQKFLEQDGMAIDLAKIDLPAVHSELHIERLTTASDLISWLHTVSMAFGYSISPDVLSHLLSAEDIRLYKGCLGQEIVATALLFLSAGVAGVHMVTTQPEHRCRGFATAMTLTALHQGQAMNYRFGTLKASAMGRRIYQKIGFQKFSTLEHYQLL